MFWWRLRIIKLIDYTKRPMKADVYKVDSIGCRTSVQYSGLNLNSLDKHIKWQYIY